MTAPAHVTEPCPRWCREEPCHGEHHPGADTLQDLRVIEGVTGSVLLSVLPVWDELDGQPPQVSLYLDNDTQIYMSAGDARSVAGWLLEAADKVDVRKMFGESQQTA